MREPAHRRAPKTGGRSSAAGSLGLHLPRTYGRRGSRASSFSFSGYRGGLLATLRRGLGLGLLLLGDLLDHVAGPRRVDANAGAHRRRKSDRAQVAALRGGRLLADDLV